MYCSMMTLCKRVIQSVVLAGCAQKLLVAVVGTDAGIELRDSISDLPRCIGIGIPADGGDFLGPGEI